MSKMLVNDISIYYETHGQGEPLIFISGFSADHSIWKSIADKFSDHFKVILFDNRGVGQSDAPEGDYTIHQMANDVFKLCESLDIKNAHFISSSMGTYILQELAYQYPDLVKTAVFCNGGMSPESPFLFYLQAQYELIKANAPIECIMKATLPWVYSYAYLMDSEKIKTLIQSKLDYPYPFTLHGYQGQYAALSSFNSNSWAKKIKCRSLVIAGSDDLIFSPMLAKMLKNEIVGASYHCFSRCGHLPHIEQPEEFTVVVNDFLSTR